NYSDTVSGNMISNVRLFGNPASALDVSSGMRFLTTSFPGIVQNNTIRNLTCTAPFLGIAGNDTRTITGNTIDNISNNGNSADSIIGIHSVLPTGLIQTVNISG